MIGNDMENYKNLPYMIVEIANSHAGDISTIESLIEKFSALEYELKGIKFQILAPEKIALPDFEWYKVYEELYLSLSQWRNIFKKIDGKNDIWLDVFDVYGVEVLVENIDLISGVKLQASVLYNHEVRAALEAADLNDKKIILNISGLEITAAKNVVSYFEGVFNSVIVQFGFQSYPTKIEDTGLSKIPILKAAFHNSELCIADHADANTGFAKKVPVYGFLMGCNYIEKHVCLDRMTAKYDGFSALTFDELSEVCVDIKDVALAKSSLFISAAEKNYLEKSIQVPVLKDDVEAGVLISESDIVYRRTSQIGLDALEIKEVQKERKVINKKISMHNTLVKEDFRAANVGVIVAGRMKSTRLPNKAILPIAGTPSVELCLKQCKGIKNAHQVILATSDLESDAVLENYTLNQSVKIWKGDPDDVIDRYLGACNHYNIDVVVRVTADCPLVIPDIIDFLLEKHFEFGADYTAADNFAVGTSAEIINTHSLQKIADIFGRAEYSEYMTWYFRNNPEHFKLNIISLPEKWTRNYRMTLDYPEDLEMFERCYSFLDPTSSFHSASDVFEVLDANPDVSKVNDHLTLKYKTDKELIERLNEMTKIPIHYK